MTSVINFANKTNKDSYEFIPLTEKSLERWIQDSDPFIVIAERDGIVGLAVAEKGWPAEPGEIQISMLCVSKDRAAASVEKALITKSEKISGAKGVVATLPIGDPKIAFYREWGFNLDGGYLHLTRSLDKLPPHPPQMKGVRIRGLENGEEEEFLKLLNVSYGRQRISLREIKVWKRDDSSFTHDWIHVVEYQGRLIGAGVSRRDVEYNAYYHAKRGYLGPSGTIPEFRRRGLNKLVNWHALKFAKQQGLDSVSLYTHEENFAVQKLTFELGYTVVYHWKLLRRSRRKKTA